MLQAPELRVQGLQIACMPNAAVCRSCTLCVAGWLEHAITPARSRTENP